MTLQADHPTGIGVGQSRTARDLNPERKCNYGLTNSVTGQLFGYPRCIAAVKWDCEGVNSRRLECTESVICSAESIAPSNGAVAT